MYNSRSFTVPGHGEIWTIGMVKELQVCGLDDTNTQIWQCTLALCSPPHHHSLSSLEHERRAVASGGEFEMALGIYNAVISRRFVGMVSQKYEGCWLSQLVVVLRA
jgi:hypothetical protein